MAIVRYSRVDNRKSFGYGSMIAIVAFVALCIFGVWMMTSSSMVPFQTIDISDEDKNEATPQEAESKVENNTADNNTPVDSNDDATTTENSNAAIENNAAAKVVQNSDAAVKNTNNVNVNTASEDKGLRNEGNQKPFEDRQGVQPGDAIKANDNNPNQPGNNAMPEPKVEDKPRDNVAENTEVGYKEAPKNGEQLEVFNETQVENKGLESMHTIDSDADNTKKKHEAVPVNTTSNETQVENIESESTQTVESDVDDTKKKPKKVPASSETQVENKGSESTQTINSDVGDTKKKPKKIQTGNETQVENKGFEPIQTIDSDVDDTKTKPEKVPTSNETKVENKGSEPTQTIDIDSDVDDTKKKPEEAPVNTVGNETQVRNKGSEPTQTIDIDSDVDDTKTKPEEVPINTTGNETRVENKGFEPTQTIDSDADDTKKKPKEVLVNTSGNETQVENKKPESTQTIESNVGNTKNKSEVPVNTAIEKHEDEKLDNKGPDDQLINVGVEKQDNQVENKNVENEKGVIESLGKKEEGKQEEEKKVVQKKNDGDKRVQENSGKTDVMKQGQVGDVQNPLENSEKTNTEKMKNKTEEKPDQGSREKKDNTPTEGIISGAHSELLNQPIAQNGSFSTQATTSDNEKESRKPTSTPENSNTSSWKLCKTTAGPDYIPCLDNLKEISKLRTTKHYEHRERHCPKNPPTCLVPLPEGYQHSIEWPMSREKVWYHNVPHTKLAKFKGHQNWVKVSGEYLTFPGGGTQFQHGALHYIDVIQQSVPEIAWGKRSRVVLDVGCGVASFGGFLFDRNVLTMSLAPKDEHEAQIQFALERGIPAISAVMGTKRLPFPGRVFDIVHCARCRVPWHIDGGMLLLELNRLLRPGGFFVWSATPIYQKLPEDVAIWEAMKKLTKAMCWEVVAITKDKINGVGIAIYRKPSTNECYEKRPVKEPPMCSESDDPAAAWNVPLQACMHKISTDPSKRGSKWPEQWPVRLGAMPYWLSNTDIGVYGKPAPEDFTRDYEHWKRVVNNSYLHGLGINWSSVRNVMDMRAVYGGLAAALKDLNIWVMNVINIDAPDTLPIIYERGLFGIYHDWCESFSTYPRSYNLLHADHLFTRIKQKCNLKALLAEVDRILRPEGMIIVRDNVEMIGELENLFKSMHWDVRMSYSKNKQGIMVAQKTMWRPKEEEILTYAISY